VALLYLRCIGEPKDLMGWCEPHLEDDTPFAPTADKTRLQSIGDWLLKMTVDHRYGVTVLRRIPVPVVRAFERKGLELEVKADFAEKARNLMVRGLRCRARFTEDNGFYDVVIEEVLDNGRFAVTYSEYGNQEEIGATDFDLGSLRPKQESSSRGGGEDDAGGGSSRSRSKDRKRSRSRSRERDRARDNDKKRSRSSDRRGGRDDRGSGRGRRDDRDGGRSGRGREGRGNGGGGEEEMTWEQEVERRIHQKREAEKSSAVSSDGRYCSQIISYKKSLSKQFLGGSILEQTNKKLDLPDSHPRGGSGGVGGPGAGMYSRPRRRDRRERSPSPEIIKKKELTREQKQQQTKLLERYGEQKTK
jgi:hypothetical protein